MIFLPFLCRKSLSSLMKSRSDNLEVKLLLFAIQKTTSFEKMLAQRFASSSYMETVSSAVMGTTVCCECRHECAPRFPCAQHVMQKHNVLFPCSSTPLPSWFLQVARQTPVKSCLTNLSKKLRFVTYTYVALCVSPDSDLSCLPPPLSFTPSFLLAILPFSFYPLFLATP